MNTDPTDEPASTRLNVTDRAEGRGRVVAVEGEVDLETAPTLRAAVQAVVDELAGEVGVVDLTAVTFLGSAGLTVLLDVARACEARGATLRIVVGANRTVVRPITITGVDEALELYDSVEEALAAG